MTNRILALVFLIFSQVIHAQHQDVLIGEEGAILLAHLEDNFKPASVLDYGNARRKMFGIVDNVNDSIYCVYTNYRIYIDPSEDPKNDAFSKGINTEHSYPQSKGANGQAKSDVHHLFPTRVDVNGERGHVPFEDIPDNMTDSWWYLTSHGSNIPNNNKDAHSESDKMVRFEPPEAFKGNIARAMMYFYTMYHDKADAADQGYFQGMIPTICQWNFEDAVNDKEWDRTWKIAQFQSGKPNPFVLDCTLAQRSYCAGMGYICTPNAIDETAKVIQDFGVFPNPARLSAKIRFTLETAFAKGQLSIYTLTGKLVDRQQLHHLTAGSNEIKINLTNYYSGFYMYSIKVKGHIVVGKLLVY